jgi:hypothetical protein
MADMPQRIAQGIKSLSTLSEDSFDQLISVLERVKPKLFPQQISNELRSKVKDISFDDLFAIVSTIMSLNGHRVHDDGTPEDLADFVVETAADSNVSIGDRETFKKRLLRFFELETLFVSGKALSILQSSENLFRGARIVTDVRPVFGSDTKAPPAAAVVVHMLDLSYQKDGNIKHLYITMDSMDIDILREALDRADTKAESLKQLIKGAAFLDPSE